MRQIRQTLHLYYQAGLSYAEVGRVPGKPKSTKSSAGIFMAKASCGRSVLNSPLKSSKRACC